VLVSSPQWREFRVEALCELMSAGRCHVIELDKIIDTIIHKYTAYTH
jgi:hypothetical protein